MKKYSWLTFLIYIYILCWSCVPAPYYYTNSALTLSDKFIIKQNKYVNACFKINGKQIKNEFVFDSILSTRADSNCVYINTLDLYKFSKGIGYEEILTVNAVLAHEKAHVLQFKKYGNITNKPEERRRIYECQADILAGYYLIFALWKGTGLGFLECLNDQSDDFLRLKKFENYEASINRNSDFLFFNLGESEQSIGTHPWRSQRSRAVEIGTILAKTIPYKDFLQRRSSNLPFLHLYNLKTRDEYKQKINTYYNLCGYKEGEDMMDWSMRQAEQIMHNNTIISKDIVFEFTKDTLPILSVIEDVKTREWEESFFYPPFENKPRPDPLVCYKRRFNLVLKNIGRKTIIGKIDICADKFSKSKKWESTLINRIPFNCEILPNDSFSISINDTINILTKDFGNTKIDTTKEFLVSEFISNPSELLASFKYKEEPEDECDINPKTNKPLFIRESSDSLSIPILTEIILSDVDNLFNNLKVGYGIRQIQNGTFNYTSYNCISEFSNITLYVPSNADSLPYITIKAYNGTKDQCMKFINNIIEDFMEIYQKKIDKGKMKIIYRLKNSDSINMMFTNICMKGDLICELVKDEYSNSFNCLISIKIKK